MGYLPVDNNRDGIIDSYGVDTSGDGVVDIYLNDANQNNLIDSTVYDTNQDNVADAIVYDLDENGVDDAQQQAQAAVPYASLWEAAVDSSGNVEDQVAFDLYVDLQEADNAMKEIWLEPTPNSDGDSWNDFVDHEPENSYEH